MIRIYTILFCVFIGCSQEIDYEPIDASVTVVNSPLIKTEYCLFDLLNGTPTEGGCWSIDSLPAGSSITASQVSGNNPCIDFKDQPCPADYKFKYDAMCGCGACSKPSTLTICLTCGDDSGCTISTTIISTCN